GATAVMSFVGRPTTYAWAGYARKREALRAAAWSIARFGKPVGLLTKHGTHAVLMTGFDASGDPTRNDSWQRLAGNLRDPLGPRHARYAPAGNAPLSRYWQLDATTAYDRQWYDRWIVVLPRS